MAIQSSAPPKTGFGKRGRVELNGTPQPSSGSRFSVPKWAMVGVAVMVVCAMMATSGGGGIGSGGLLGGLLGGMLAGKLMQSAKTPSAPMAGPSAAHAGAPTAHAPPANHIARGGFGATGATAAGAAG